MDNKQSIYEREISDRLAKLLDAAEAADKAGDPALYQPARESFFAHLTGLFAERDARIAELEARLATAESAVHKQT